MNNTSKSSERKCLDIVKHISNYDCLQGEIQECERPDFLINGTTGVEHFLIDVISNNGSISRQQLKSIQNKIEEYKDTSKLDLDISSGRASDCLQNLINNQINGMSDFNYKTFITNFKRVFDKHYENVSAYREKCNTLGFLIEIPYIKPIGSHGYIITNKGQKRNQVLKTIPISRDMIRCFKAATELDFIILCMIPFNFSGNYSECSSIKLDVQNIEKSVTNQGMIICDEFDYSQKFLNKNVVSINVKKEEGL